MMVGRSMDAEFPKHKRWPGEVRLRAKNLFRGNKVKGVF